MEASEAIFTRVSSTFLADTGTGGLANTASAAYVRQFLRDGHFRERATQAWPRVTVGVNSQELGVPTGQTTTQGFDGVVRFTIESDRDTGLGSLDRVESRIRDVFHNTTLSALVDTDSAARTWKFAPMGRLSPRGDREGGGESGKTLFREVSYRVLATKGAT